MKNLGKLVQHFAIFKILQVHVTSPEEVFCLIQTVDVIVHRNDFIYVNMCKHNIEFIL